jgi:uncharacterized membrane protein YkvA (DUF1232 family)
MRFLVHGYRQILSNPRYGGWVLLGTLLYLISPIDLSPDLIPLLGQIDDVALIVLLISVVSQWLSEPGRKGQSSEPDTVVKDSGAPSQTIDVQAVEIDTP